MAISMCLWPVTEVNGLPAILASMLRSPEDEAVQLQGIEQLFMEQTQVG